jgi:lysozyme family protein
MSTFDAAIEVVLQKELGYVCDPDDAGGETCFGISKRSYPNVDIKNLTREGASDIYRRDYWQPIYEAIPDQALATKIFELTVHCGIEAGVKMVQRALRGLGDPVVSVDGRFGPQTLQAVKLVSSRALLAAIRVKQCRHYLDIVGANPSQKRFFVGWIRRALT